MSLLQSRRSATALGALFAAIIAVVLAGQPSLAATPAPASMASLGDSITRGFNACGWYVDCTSRSWSTGDDSNVNSHYRRVLAGNPVISGKNYNNAKSGATSFDIPGQVNAALANNPEYFTLLIGANDACKDSESQMTSVADYRANIDSGLAAIKANAPTAKVFVASIPDIKRMWSVSKGSWAARRAWSLFGICETMLANPTSNAAADEQRRDRVQQRVIDYNSELEKACSAYGDNCKFDGNAVFRTEFQFGHVSGWDYFHPNAAGQKLLADVSYRAGFGW